jgi:hypothetical protein
MRKGNPYLGTIVDNREPQNITIEKHNEPLLPQGYAYAAYMSDGTPCYMEEQTIAELEARVRAGFVVKSITLRGE